MSYPMLKDSFNNQYFWWRLVLLWIAFIFSCNCALTEELLGNQIQGVEIECDPAEIRLKVKTTESFLGRIYPRGLGKSPCEKVYDMSNSTGNGTVSLYSVPLTSCNTLLHDIPTGLEYQNVLVIQVHRSLVTQSDRVYNVRCKYESMNTIITATMNMSDNLPAMQLESSSALPVVSMSIYKGTSESRVMADYVTIGDPVALVINLARQNTYGMLIRDCTVKDGVDMGGFQPLLDNRGCPVDSTLFGGFIYSSDLTQAYVIFRAHKFPYADSLYYECSVKFCLKIGGECQHLPTPPNCEKQRHKRSDRSANVSREAKLLFQEDAKTVAVVRGMKVREPFAETLAADIGNVPFESSSPAVSSGQWCVPRSAFAVILAVTTFLIVLSVTILVAVVLEKRRRRINQKLNCSDAYSSIYMSHFSADETRTIR